MTYVNANILIRLFGILCIFFGVLGCVFIAATLLLIFAGAPLTMTENLWPYAAQSLVASPIWILGGFVAIKLAPRLAALAEKRSDDT